MISHISPRESWIQWQMDRYRVEFPNYRESDYRRWAEHTIDDAVHSLGDYFSRSSYEKT